MSWLFGLAGPLFFTTASAMAPMGPARKIRAPLREPLSSAACAEILLDASTVSRPIVGQITATEVATIHAVPDEPAAIRDFLAELFAGVNGQTLSARGAFEALWRRLPERRAPNFGNLLSDKTLVASWQEFKRALATVPVSRLDLRLPSNLWLKYDERAARNVAALPPELLGEILNMPWDARTIVNWLRARSKQSVRQPGWGDQSFDHLWRQTFGVARPWSLLGKYDADQVIFRKILPDGPADRLLQEWRLFVIYLNFHRR